MEREIWTTIGDVRGCCGHEHRSRDAAETCLRRDQRGCAAQGGYSDRLIYRQTGGCLQEDDCEEQ